MIVSQRKLSIELGVDQVRLREIAKRAGAYYRSFDLRTLGSSKWRHIDHPQEPLQGVQRRVLRQVLETAKLPPTMTGGLPGRSLVDHAGPHCNRPLVITLDLAHCFPSISDRRVFEVFNGRLNYSPKLAGILTKLTTFHRRLPQGASTSAYLAALVTEPLHLALLDFARANNLNFTQFVDDLAFSGDAGAQALVPTIVSIVQKHGFALSRAKVEIMPAKRQQVVTGVVVNRGLSAGAERLSEIREQIADYREALFVLAAEHRSLEGKLAFVESLRPAQAERLRRYALLCMPDVADLPPVLKSSTVERRPCACTRIHEAKRSRSSEQVARQGSLPGLGRRAFPEAGRPATAPSVPRRRRGPSASSQLPMF